MMGNKWKTCTKENTKVGDIIKELKTRYMSYSDHKVIMFLENNCKYDVLLWEISSERHKPATLDYYVREDEIQQEVGLMEDQWKIEYEPTSSKECMFSEGYWETGEKFCCKGFEYGEKKCKKETCPLRVTSWKEALKTGTLIQTCECGNEFNVSDWNYKCPKCGFEIGEE